MKTAEEVLQEKIDYHDINDSNWYKILLAMEEYAEQQMKRAFYAGVHYGEKGIDYENGGNAESCFKEYYQKHLDIYERI